MSTEARERSRQMRAARAAEVARKRRRRRIVNIIGAVVIQCTWVALGFWLGEPARVVVEAYARISMYVAFAILIGVFAGVFWQRRRSATTPVR